MTMKPPSRNILVAAMLALGCGAIAWVTATLAFDNSNTGARHSPLLASVVVDNHPLARDSRLSSSFAPIVKRVAPCVVNVFTTKTVRNPLPDLHQFFDDPFFRRFFDGTPGDNDPRRTPRTFKERSLGSGVVVTEDGYILTNNHVVDGADEVQVAFEKDKTKYTSKVIGHDPKTDIAVLKIEATKLPFATLGDSDKIAVGDVVLALGNPFGIGQTVTMGIVSAIRRGGMGIEDYEDFVQTDAAINPGNSGGALVDAEGRLVGINTAILSRSGGNQGVGFAVPVNLARNVMDQLVKKGRVERGYLGVSIQDLTPDLARQFHVADGRGALVGEVTKDGPAFAAGLKSGDVITEFDGKSILDSRNLKLAVGNTTPGSKVEVKVLRDGKEKSFTIVLKEIPDEKKVASGHSRDNESDALNGVTVGDLDSSARGQFHIPDSVQGAVISDIDQGSASYDAGLRTGDVIQEINRKPVKNAEEAVEASKHVNDKRVLLLVWSHGASHYVVVDESRTN